MRYSKITNSSNYLIGLFGGVLMTLFFAAWGYYYFEEPAEDALILYCFSESLADTGVISYYPGGEPAEGATDFLWMLAISLLYKIGIPSFFASHLLSGFSFVGLLVFIRKIWRWAHRGNIPTPVFILVAFVLLAQRYMLAAALGFSVWFFAFFISAVLYYYLKQRIARFAVSGLFLCLVRPDGFFLVFPLTLFLLYNCRKDWKNTIRLLSVYAIAPGVIYFLARYFYFGLLLPLPFYVKSSTKTTLFILGNLKLIWLYFRDHLFELGLLLIGIFCYQISNIKLYIRDHISFLGVITSLFFVAMIYTLFRLEQNVMYRFFVLLGIPFLCIFICVSYVSAQRHILTITLLMTCLHGAWKIYNMPALPFYKGGDVRHAVGRLLGEIEPKGKIFVGSAGALAYYSKWEVYDAWGLATKEFSQQLIMPEAVSRIKPDVIFSAPCEQMKYNASKNSCFDVTEIEVKSERSFDQAECNITKGARQGYDLFQLGIGDYFIFIRKDSDLYGKVLHKLQNELPSYFGFKYFCNSGKNYKE